MSTRAPRRPSTPKTARSGPGIEPRLRDRRVAVKRAEGRRRLRILVVLAVVVVLGAGGWLAVHSALLDIDRVVVTGAQRVSAAQVGAASGLRRGEPILLVDLGAARRRVEAIPWVDRARVRRDLPGRIEIRVTERTAIAWAHRPAGTVALVDGSGRVVADVGQPPAGLTELRGASLLPAPGGRVRPAAAVGVVTDVPQQLRAMTTAVLAQDGAVSLQLANGPEVRLGEPDDVAAKGRAALAVLQASAGQAYHYVDVRDPTSPVTG